MTFERIKYIDVAKGITSILVILGHLTTTPYFLKIWIYSFHIPLFFFLSGFVMNTAKYKNIKSFLKNKIQKSIIPYIYLSIITWIIVKCINSPIKNLDLNSIKSFFGIFICIKGTPYYLTLWFIISLFFDQIIIYTLSKYDDKKMIIGLIMLFLLGYFISIIYKPGWLFVSDTVPMASFFVGIGYISRKYSCYIKQLLKHQYLIIFFILNYIFTVCNLEYVTRMDLYYQKIGNPILYLFSAMSGILMTLILSNLFSKIQFLQYVGKNSLIFYAFHRPIFIPFAKYVINLMNISSTHLLKNNIIVMFCSLIIICAGLILTTELVNKFFPVIVGKNYKKIL